MNFAFVKTKTSLTFTEILYLVFFIGLICAFRAVTSICIGTMVLAGLILNRSAIKAVLKKNPAMLFAFNCSVFFFLQCLSLLYTTDLPTGLNDARLKSGLVFTPLALLVFFPCKKEEPGRLCFGYCILLFFASAYLLCVAFIEYLKHKTISIFFYHALVSPFRFHAVYYSILVFFALLFLIESLLIKKYIFNKLFHIALTTFFTLFLFLLASKLVICLYIVYCLFLLTKKNKNHNQSRLLYTFTILVVISSLFISMTKNPVKARFTDLINGNITLFNKDKFSPAVYFNGLQFRLLQWKLVPQILNERQAWWTGVSTGDAQELLSKKYISLNMYRGEPGKSTTGYLGYNTHNQLLQSLLQSGIPGVLSFLFICASLIMMAIQAPKRILSFTIILLLCYLMVESLFEEQYGIVLFTFWPLFINGYCKANTIPLKTKEPL
jgi:O-antigen ligase